ncbi:MAG: hypothetical protein LUF78_06320 [Clostridiales bacterium]|nr:hypothetical protein [Clostridiales bacterium]
MKRLTVYFCCLALLTGAVSPVYGAAAEDTLNAEDGITIGVAVYDTENAEVLAFQEYFRDYLATSFNAEFLYSESIMSAEEEIAFIDQLHEEGVPGVISFLSTNLEEVLPVCEEYGMYYILGSSTISDEVYEAVKDNPYFLGTIGPSTEMEEQAGQDMAACFAEQDTEGTNHYLIACGGTYAENEMHILRTQGMLEALQEAYDLEYQESVEDLAAAAEVTEISTGNDSVAITLVPGYPSTDTVIEDMEDFLSTGDYNVVLSVIGLYYFMDDIDAAEKTFSMDILTGTIECFTDDNYQYFNTNGYGDTSRLNYLTGKYGAMVAPSFVAMYNAFTGYAEDFRENGSAFSLTQSYWTATDTEEFNDLYGTTIGLTDNTYSATDMMEVMMVYNEEADFEAFKEFTEK